MTLTQHEGTSNKHAHNASSVSVIRHPSSGELTEVESIGRRSSRYKGLAVSLTVATIGGFLCGFIAFLAMGLSRQPTQRWTRTEGEVVTQTVVPVTNSQEWETTTSGSGATAAIAEAKAAATLEEVRTRNRRLEALVKVLRQRNGNNGRPSAIARAN